MTTKKREWLISARKALHLTQAQMAKASGLSQNGYSNIEKGVRRPSVEAAMRIANAIGKEANKPRQPLPEIYWTDFFD